MILSLLQPALKEDEQIPPIIKDESEDIIEEMGDDRVQEQQQEEPVLELDLQTDMPELSQENTEQTKDEDESDQHEHEMIFSIAGRVLFYWRGTWS